MTNGPSGGDIAEPGLGLARTDLAGRVRPGSAATGPRPVPAGATARTPTDMGQAALDLDLGVARLTPRDTRIDIPVPARKVWETTEYLIQRG